MSITITCQFQHPYQAQQAAQRLRRRGFTVSQRRDTQKPENLLVAYPYGTTGGNTFGNGLMGAMPPMAENGVLTGAKRSQEGTVLSVLTDDTQTRDAKLLLESLGGKIL